ncbi:MAG: fructose-bisphosphate aldolase [Nitrososphaerota archaeon]
MTSFEIEFSSIGKLRRFKNIFSKDGKALIVAMDHGMIGDFRCLEHIEIVAKKMIDGGADALLVTPAIGKYLAKKIKDRISLVLSIPYDEKYVEYAVKLGADAVKTTYFGPVPLDWETMNKVWRVSLAAEEWGMPYMAEVVPCDEKGKVIYDVEKVKQAARIGAELGGDIIKTAYVGPPSRYSEVVKSTPVPITVMGGPKIESLREFLLMLKEAVEAGAKGGTIGRNIWQHEKPEKVVKALVAILHEDKEVEEALNIIEK